MKLTLKIINTQCESKNIRCVSTNYINNKGPLDWQCLVCNYIFIASKNSIDRDFTKCKQCKINICNDKINQRIKALGGQCFSTYTKSTDKLHFKCKNNHEFWQI